MTLHRINRDACSRKCRSQQAGFSGMETLEGRRMLSVTVSVSGNILSFIGDDSPNQIGIHKTTLVGSTFVDVTKYVIVVNGRGGNDRIVFDVDARPIRSRLSGGDGDDVIFGTISSDQIFGGKGNDTIRDFTNTADYSTKNYIYGGSGRDLIKAACALNFIYGDGPNDVNLAEVDGGCGDTIYGGNQRDVITAGSGADLVYGGEGNDYVDAGNWKLRSVLNDGVKDSIYGGSGNDFCLIGDTSKGVFDVTDCEIVTRTKDLKPWW